MDDKSTNKFDCKIVKTILVASFIQAGILFLSGGYVSVQKELKLHAKKHNEIHISLEDASNFRIKQELLPLTNYLPDIETINV